MDSSTHNPTSKAKRKLLSLPPQTHKLISRVAALRGMTLSDTLYVVLRDELRRQEDGDAWAFAPSPFSIKPTYNGAECLVLLWHPALPSLQLSRKEASDLAEALHVAAEGGPLPASFIFGQGAHRISLTRGGYYVSLGVDDTSLSMIRPVAVDVADALISASAHAGPIPAGKPH